MDGMDGMDGTPLAAAAPLLVRTALPAEAGVLAGLMARARSTYYPDGLPDAGADWIARWREAVERPDGQVLCAVREGRVLGLASFRPPPGASAGTVMLYQFHVDPGHWGAGIGTALHAACAGQWRADGHRRAVLEVHADNQRAQRFYAGRGWLPDPVGRPAPGSHHLSLTYAVTRE
ncbi:GNAT family N-acetyltransferase [Streptomyces sp. NPDC047017]|uniref:GNAT family N-acetyltransferase n=1 Tax=Streptomyces sp. NPDC047017 TaxID=3155024 RepID=UPI0033E6619C